METSKLGKMSKWSVGLIAILAVVLILIIYRAMPSAERTALARAKALVTDQIKYPLTAVFRDPIIQHEEDGVFYILYFVEAENGFGVPGEITFECVIDTNKDIDLEACTSLN